MSATLNTNITLNVATGAVDSYFIAYILNPKYHLRFRLHVKENIKPFNFK